MHLHTILVGICSSVVLLKLFEMWKYSIFWTMTNGKQTSDKFHEKLAKKGLQAAQNIVRESGYKPWAVTQAIFSILPPRLQDPLRVIFFSWPFLTFYTSVLLATSQKYKINLWLLTMLLLALLFTKDASRFAARMRLGVADNFTQKNWNDEPDIRHMTRIAREAATEILVDAVTLTTTFGVIYTTYDGIDWAFLNPVDSPVSLMKGIYFSFVTVTTTGYGDIFPVSKWSVLLSLTQMLLTWSLVVIMGFHYGLTLADVGISELSISNDDQG